MELHKVIADIRSRFRGFRPAASADALQELQPAVGFVPDDVRTLYRDHDGSEGFPKSNDRWLAARLMPIAEMIDTRQALRECTNTYAEIGEVLWLWTDDNSNYCGIYTGGLLRGWLCVLDHEEPMLAPAFRSVSSFMSQLLFDASREDGSDAACDIPSLIRDVPLTASDPMNLEADRLLSNVFRQRYAEAADDDLRRLCAVCSICLTPVEDTEKVLIFLTDPDTWTPEDAVRLLELRRWQESVEELETLARDGSPNGDSAAMRLLARMKTNESRQVIARLKETLQGGKLQILEMWTDPRRPVPPPRW